jgi:hypothetical protein
MWTSAFGQHEGRTHHAPSELSAARSGGSGGGPGGRGGEGPEARRSLTTPRARAEMPRPTGPSSASKAQFEETWRQWLACAKLALAVAIVVLPLSRRIHAKPLGGLGPFPRQLEKKLTTTWIAHRGCLVEAVPSVFLVQLFQRRDHRRRHSCRTHGHLKSPARTTVFLRLGSLAGF